MLRLFGSDSDVPGVILQNRELTGNLDLWVGILQYPCWGAKAVKSSIFSGYSNYTR